MRLKGCLWKPGINGLGVRGMRHLPYRKRFDEAARHHDWMYDQGGGSKSRTIADIEFLRDCLKQCNTPTQAGFAIFYYLMVRLFGWLFYHYKN